MKNATEIWALYEKGQEHHRRIDLYAATERAHRFMLGDQWESGEDYPVMNLIAPTVKNKVATVAQGQVAITFTPQGSQESRAAQTALCERLGEFAASRWESFKLDTLAWQTVRDAAVAGDSYLYFYDADGRAEVLDNTNIYLGDEQCRDIQRQPYILIAERRLVSDVVAQGRKAGVKEKALAEIAPDDSTGHLLSEQARAEVGGDKCTCLLYLYKDEAGYVHTVRSTRSVIYQPDRALCAIDGQGRVTGGLTRYPLVSFVWQSVKGSARGRGEVAGLIPNQTELNKTLARRAQAVRNFAYPKLVYDKDRVDSVDALTEVGAQVAVDNLAGTPVSDLITYLSPAPIGSAAERLTDELLGLTRELAGSGDAAVGSIDPEKASGAAILAVRDLAQLPLNEQIATYRQFVEDIASLWLEMWCIYHPEGLTLLLRDGTEEFVEAAALRDLRVAIRIDISSESPYSRYAAAQALDGLFNAGHLTLDEYVSLLDSHSALPKGKLEQLLARRTNISEEAENL